MASLQQITTRAKRLYKSGKSGMTWTQAIQMASKQLAPKKKAAVSGTKKAKPATKVTIKAKSVKVAGIGCTSTVAMKEMQNTLAGIEQGQNRIKQLQAKMKDLPKNQQAAYKKEIERHKALIKALNAQKRIFKTLV